MEAVKNKSRAADMCLCFITYAKSRFSQVMTAHLKQNFEIVSFSYKHVEGTRLKSEEYPHHRF